MPHSDPVSTTHHERPAAADYGEPTSTWLSSQEGGIRVARFRCGADHPRWRRLNRSGGNLLVFPRGPVRIRSRAGDGGIVDSGHALFYLAGQEYERECVDPRGDRCEFFDFDTATLVRLAPALDPARLGRRSGPIVFAVAPADYALQRLLYRHAVTGTLPPRPVFERALAHLLAAVPAAQAQRRPPGRHADRHRALVERVRELLALRLDEPLKLDELGRRVGASGPHLCRVFGEVTGQTIHAYRDSLRLRASLEALEQGAPDLTQVALDLGYSSHAHFTQRFTSAFGAAPSHMRARLFRPPTGDGGAPLHS